MVFLETQAFTRRVIQLLSDDEYRQLQNALVARPEAGAVIPGSGGIRKLRWGLAGRGKRGGARVIYYWAKASDQILLLFLFAKNEADDLTTTQLQQLRAVLEETYP
ncbi:MAG: type II toxin-antitoxin system RelE/ParE family toxin [Abitibacteriaceae bacterium]|nr:type II toxin-antitoxin system RelE/ParE family toxin [Abditibacteriaceae bacterium]MBV9867047.1 type II toxin-antitoxin system RelE/ParE family toxin [Abditibacteriaceae bacterium]